MSWNGIDSRKETTLRAMMFSAIAFALIGFSKILFNMIISRSFGQESMIILGMANIAVSFALLISMACSTGFSNAINKFMSDCLSRKDEAGARNVFDGILIRNLVVILPISLFILIFHDKVAVVLGIDNVYLLLAIAIAITSSFYYILRATMYSLNDTKRYLLLEFISNMIFFFILTISILLSLPAYTICSFFAMYLIFIILSAREIGTKLHRSKNDKKKSIKGIEIYAGLTTIGTILSVSIIYLANIYTGASLGADDAALFAAAFSTASMLLMIPNVMSMVLLPRMSFLWGKMDIRGISARILFWTKSLIIICGIIIVPFAFLGREILSLLFGNEYSVAHLTMVILLIGILFQTISRPSNIALVSAKYIHIPALISIISFIVAISMWLITVPYFGINGVALGFLSAAVINSLGSMIFAERYWHSGFKKYSLPVTSMIFLGLATLFLYSKNIPLNEISCSIIFATTFILINYKFIRQFLKEIKSM